jgi:PAS domain S-box-containing protein
VTDVIDPPHPPDEVERVEAVRALRLLDTPPEERFDRITRIASRLFRVPIALVSLIDANRQWFKSCVGMSDTEVPRGVSFCSYALLGDEALVIHDTHEDPRFAQNPLVVNDPRLRFYAGHILRGPSGHKLGTLCLVDSEPRGFDARDQAVLADLATWAEQEMANVELNAAHAARGESEQRLRTVMDNVPDGIVTFRADGIVESINPAAASVFGWPADELVGLSVDRLVQGLPWGRVAARLGIAGVGEIRPSVLGHRMETVGRRRDGTRFPLELTIGRADLEGRPVFVAVGRDISGRRAADAALEAARRRSRLLLDTVAEGILGIAREGTVTFANPAAGAMLLREPGEIVGCPVDEVLPRMTAEGDVPSFRATLLEEVLGEGGHTPVRIERRVWRGDGTVFPAEIVVAAAEGDEGVAAVLLFRDLTERYEIDRMKDEFVSVVGHELRTPLTSIRGSLGLLEGGVAGELPAEAQRMLTIATTNTDRLVRLINDILDLERIESGRVELELEQVPVRELLDATIEVVGATADAAQVTLAVEAQDVTVAADRDRLVQALVNLAGNAVKFSPPGETVVLACAPAADGVRVEVRDRGRGIPADRLDRIFERFEQVDPSDAREKGGTGLGLAIARSIAEAHGGRIEVASELGAGSTFCLLLPSADRAQQPGAGGAPQVLVVEDDADLAGVPAHARRAPRGPGHRRAQRAPGHRDGRRAPAGRARARRPARR